MHSAALAVKFIEQRLSYPLQNIDALLGTLGDNDRLTIGNCHISRGEISGQMPGGQWTVVLTGWGW